MVHACVVCKKVDHFNPNVSFHRFPQDPERRKLWFSLVGISEDQPLRKNPELCSDHFYPEDILVKVNGAKYIRKDANPRRCEGLLFLDDLSNSSGSSVFGTPPVPKKVLPISKLCLEAHELPEIVENSPNIDNPENTVSNLMAVPGPSAIGINSPKPKTDEASSSVTETASEIEFAPVEKNCAGVDAQRTKRKRRYIGDMTSSDFSTPEKRRKNVKIIKNTITEQRRNIYNLKRQVKRLKDRVKTLSGLLRMLKGKFALSESAESSVRASVTGPAADIFESMIQGKKRYNESLKAFALTLAFYSPRAYNFVRKTFNKSLPHIGTISTWYRSVDGSPGFSPEALKALETKQNSVSYPLLCNLVMDEMSIRRQVEWTGTKFSGYVDIGTNIEGDILPEAKEVLVFMLVCLNGAWKVPVRYFLLDGLAANEKANLVLQCLRFVHKSGVQVTSLTFDGAPVNLSMAENLGANFSNPKSLKTFFSHPVTDQNVYFYLDPCHMLKLVRNCFASQDGMKDLENRDIKWKFICELVKLQNDEGLHAATKVRLRHLKWDREKMKVRLATQTLSKSVSDAITFARDDCKYETFSNSEGTSDFILKFNNLFDIFNSRNKFNKYFYKRPLSKETSLVFLDVLEEMKNYIIGLTLNGRIILNSSRKTGFLGFLICMESLKNMYFDLVEEKKSLIYILTYKLSQDHLELFFGAIRTRGGHNNNPTARQFEASFKRLLVHNQITAPETGNAINLGNISILTCGYSNITNSKTGQLEQNEGDSSLLAEVMEDVKINFLGSNAWDLTIYSQDVVGYIAEYVVKSLKKCISCFACLNLLESKTTPSLLLKRKKYGNLIMASELVVETCKTAERFFRFFHTTKSIFNKNIKNLNEILVVNSLKNLPSSIWDCFGDHIFDEEVLNDHHVQLVKLILRNYFKIRIHYETVKILDSTRVNRTRSLSTKLILFRNE